MNRAEKRRQQKLSKANSRPSGVKKTVHTNPLEALKQWRSLLQLGKYDEALSWYEKVLQVQPSSTVALSNIGGILQIQGKLDDASKNYQKAIAINPEFADAHYNLGIVLEKQGNLDAAVVSYQKTLAVKPNYAGANNNLGNILRDQGEFDAAVACYQEELAIQPDFADAYYNLGIAQQEQGNLDIAATSFQKALSIKPGNAKALTYLAIIYWLKDDLPSLEQCMMPARSIDIYKKQNDEFVVPYQEYLSRLLECKNNKQELYQHNEQLPVVYLIGDSHCLTATHLIIELKGMKYRVQSKIIVGCKAWHLANRLENKYKFQLREIAKTIPDKSIVLITLGEIDSRVNEGIIKFHRKTNNNLSESIENLAKEYVDFVNNTFCNKQDVILGNFE